jgi:glutamate-1-semialdehyde 2,1-aminomutase
MEKYLKEYTERTPGSARLYARAKQVMPGGVSHNMRYFAPYPVYIQKAAGSRIWDVDGNEYVDLWMGHYAHILGHRPEPIFKVLQEKIAEGTHWGIVTESQIAFAEDICRIVPCAEKIRFGVSGTEATMYAVRLARAHTGRNVILKVRGGWHGAGTDLSVGLHVPMDVPESAGLPPGVAEYTRTISFNDTEGTLAAIRQYRSDLAGVIIEAVGQYFIPPAEGYLEAVLGETRKVGAVFILDEIINGFRLSLRGAQGRYGLKPDLATMGKVLGGGMHLGVVAGRKEIMDLASPTAGLPKGRGVLMGGGTFSCMLPSMIAGRTMLRYLEEHEKEIYPALDEKGQRVRQGIEKAFRSCEIPVKCFGVGSLFTTCFPSSGDVSLRNIEDTELHTDIARRDKQFRIMMLNKGVYTIYGGGAISMAHTQKDIEYIIKAAGEVAEEMSHREDQA